MKAIVALDRAIQRAIDAGAFALMRAGVKKWQIHYALGMLAAFGTAIGLLAIWLSFSAGLIGCGIGCSAILFCAIDKARRQDAIADSRGMLGPSDLASPIVIKTIGMIDLTLSPLHGAKAIAICSQRQLHLSTIAIAVVGLAFLAKGYLMRTPKDPPQLPASRLSLALRARCRMSQERSERPSLGVAATAYMSSSMAMPNSHSDQEQNWILGHLMTFAMRAIEADRKAPFDLAKTPRRKQPTRAARRTAARNKSNAE